jgi:DNA-binding SARP family transcriptional activator
VLRLLGPITIGRNGLPIEHPDWRRERVRALLALIAQRGALSPLDACEALWPELAPGAAANNLRVTLSYLQRFLEPDRVPDEPAFHVRADSAAIRFVGRGSWTTDVDELERLLDRAEGADADGDLRSCLASSRAGLDWYRGPWLADGRLTASDEIERDRLRSRFVGAAVRLGSLLAAVGEHEEAHRLAVDALRADPWSELAAALDVSCHLDRGDRAAAARSYERSCALLAELGLEPSEALTRLDHALRSVHVVDDGPEPMSIGASPTSTGR